MDEYIRILLEQVRCRKAHEMIEEEIRNHIEDQAEANMAVGMSRSEALEEAVRDMGDPIEVGIAMDRIHRPALAWNMVLMAAVISIAGIVIHIAIGNNQMDSFRFAFHTIFGFGIMLFIYRLDYIAFCYVDALCAGLCSGSLSIPGKRKKRDCAGINMDDHPGCHSASDAKPESGCDPFIFHGSCIVDCRI